MYRMVKPNPILEKNVLFALLGKFALSKRETSEGTMKLLWSYGDRRLSGNYQLRNGCRKGAMSLPGQEETSEGNENHLHIF